MSINNTHSCSNKGSTKQRCSCLLVHVCVTKGHVEISVYKQPETFGDIENKIDENYFCKSLFTYTNLLPSMAVAILSLNCSFSSSLLQ